MSGSGFDSDDPQEIAAGGTRDHSDLEFLQGGGQMGRLMRAKDWSETPLSDPQTWPQSLRTSVSTCLSCSFPILLWWGPDLIKIYNDAYASIIGGKHPFALGAKGREVWPEIWDVIQPMLASAMAGRATPANDLLLMLERNGYPEECYFSFSYSPIRDESGGVGGVFCPVIETTDTVVSRRRLDQLRRLADETADLHSVQDVLAAAAASLTHAAPDFPFAALYAASGGEGSTLVAATGISDTELERIDWPFGDALGEPVVVALDALNRQIPSAAVGRPQQAVLLQLSHSPGCIALGLTPHRPIEEMRNAARLIEGQISSRIAGALAVEADLARVAAVADRERDRIFAMSRDLFGVASFEGRLISINPAWSRVLNRPEADLLARPFSEIIHPDDLATTGEVLVTLQSGLPVHQFHVRLLKSDGESIAFAWSAVPDAALESGLFYTVGRDITEETAAAVELQEAQEALRQSQKMEAVGQLTGGIAHDFNNLLAGIAGSLELIQKRITEQGMAGFDRHMGIAQASTQRAAALTQRLLAFSRRQTLDPKPVDVNRLIGGVEDLFRRSVGPNIEISFVGAIGLWVTKIDAPQLENALLNLVINARDAMPDGGRITIETANKWIDGRSAKDRDLTPGQYISICVTDTGSGMTAEVIERAFDPFYTTKPLGQGTGLGLSMIHGFVRQSSGQVRIYSEVGQGTTMCLYLPRFAGELGVDDVAEPQDALEPGLGETVLVIDDEEPIRMLISDVLEEAGYRVLEAADGPAGLKILQSDSRIDLLITDVGLPGGYNGRQVADAARETRPDLKVLFVTGYAENAVVGNGHLEPGMQVITKPFQMTALALRVREIIED